MDRCPACGCRLTPSPKGNVVVEGKVTRETEKAVLLDFVPKGLYRARQVWISKKLIEGEVAVGTEGLTVAAWFAQKERLEVRA